MIVVGGGGGGGELVGTAIWVFTLAKLIIFFFCSSEFIIFTGGLGKDFKICVDGENLTCY